MKNRAAGFTGFQRVSISSSQNQTIRSRRAAKTQPNRTKEYFTQHHDRELIWTSMSHSFRSDSGM